MRRYVGTDGEDGDKYEGSGWDEQDLLALTHQGHRFVYIDMAGGKAGGMDLMRIIFS